MRPPVRRLIATLSFIALLCPGLAIAASTFKIATIAPEGTNWMTEMRAVAERIEQRTGGEVKLKFYPGGVMGSDQAVLRKMRIGQLQGGALSGGGLSSIYPDADIYSMPFLFRSVEEVRYVRDKLDGRIAKGLAEQGVVLLGIADGGFAYLFSEQPIASVEDIKPRKVWVPEGDQVASAVFQELGVSPIGLPIADVYTSLQTGLIDTVGATPTSLIAFQWHTKMAYRTETPMLFLTGGLVIDRNAFGRLSEAHQAVMREELKVSFERLSEVNIEDNQAAWAALEGQSVDDVEVSPEELASWRAAAERARAKLVSDGVYSAEMLELVNSHLQAFRQQQSTSR